jgi:hypothetical protein
VAKKSDPPPAAPAGVDWCSPAARVLWLIDHRFRGNRSALAEALGLSHTAVLKVVGGRPPGHKFITAAVEHVGVNPNWLVAGQGAPFQDAAGAQHIPVGLPIARTPLPGPPQRHPDLLTGVMKEDAGVTYSPSRYWLRLARSQPLLRDSARGFRWGDFLLMEADRTRFPRERAFYNELCVLRVDPKKPLQLASVTYHTDTDPDDLPGKLTADFFDVPDSSSCREEVYSHLPGGEIRHEVRRLRRAPFRDGERLVPVDRNGESNPSKVSYSHVLAVWLRLLNRPSSK